MIDFASFFFPKQEAPKPAPKPKPMRVGGLWVGWPIDEEYKEFRRKNGDIALSRKLDIEHDKMMSKLGRTETKAKPLTK